MVFDFSGLAGTSSMFKGTVSTLSAQLAAVATLPHLAVYFVARDSPFPLLSSSFCEHR
jgi:hypothetical protein